MMQEEDTELVQSFLGAAADRDRFTDGELLALDLRSRFLAGCQSWPGVPLGRAAYGRYLAQRQIGGELPQAAIAPDLFIACACAQGAPGALAAFEERFGATVRRAVSRVDSSPSFVDEALQVLREKLFVAAAGSRPQIEGYFGRATLRSWVASTAVRTALKMRRRKDDKRHETLRCCARVGDDQSSPELEYLRKRYAGAFDAAVRAAILRLPPRDRALLLLHLGERMSVDRLAALYQVGRSTAARWLAKARSRLFEETRRELCGALGITPSELDSLAAVVRSKLEISVVRYLGEASGDGGRPHS
jgi:RNA polymerase sigma-70 factor (ECF subfamily)